MKKSIFLIMILGLVALSANNKATQTTQYFVQFKVNTITENSQATVIDQSMQNQNGFFMSRTDYITSTYYGILNPGVDYTESDFTAWFSDLGYTISCFNKGVQNIDPVISPSELKNCQ